MAPVSTRAAGWTRSICGPGTDDVMAYLARRLALGLVTLWLVTLAAFLLLRIAPGDAVSAAVARSPGEGGVSSADLDQLRRELGLDRSWPVQYGDWLGDAFRLDPGTSLASGRSVIDEISPRLVVTAELTVLALAFTVILGVAGGLLAARYASAVPDTLIRGGAFVALSVPSFWLALVLIVAIASWTGHFLALGYEPFLESPWANLAAVVPAAAILTIRPSAMVLRVTRASTLDAANAQYFVMARARGFSRQMALVKHAFRTAMLPTVTVIGAQTVLMLGGAVVIEQVFGLPGLGRLLVESVLARDFPVIQALVLLFGLSAITVNLLVDLAYVRLDPRLRVAA